MVLMNFIRKGAVASLTSGLVLLLFALAFDVGIWRSVGQPDNVKKVLADSGIYNSVVPNALSQAGKISTAGGDIPLNDPQIQAAAKSAIPPSQVRQDANQIIDSVYSWLNGKTPAPSFNIDLNSAKVNFASNIGEVVAQRAASLPACTAFSGTSFDAYNATCLPPGVTPSAAATEVKSQVLNGQGFLDKPVVNAASVKTDSGKSVFDNQRIPKTYQRLKEIPWVIALLIIVFSAGIVFLSSSRRRGARRVSLALVGVGIFMLLFAWGVDKAASSVVSNIKINNNAAGQQQLRTVVKDLAQAIDKNYWLFGAVYIVLGTAALASIRWLLPKLRPHQAVRPSKMPNPPGESPAQQSA